MMKVCIFTETYYPVFGGGETQAKLLAEGLVAAGNSVIILTRRSDASQKAHESFGDVKVYRMPPVGRGQLKKWGLLLSAPGLLIKLREHYDLIFVSGYRIAGLAAVLIGRLLHKPVVLKADSQGEMSGEFFDGGLRKFGASRSSLPFRAFLRFRNFVLHKADIFSAISPEIVNELRLSGVPSEKIELIPNSVDISCYVPVNDDQKQLLRRQLNLPASAAIVLYTGRLVSYKGLPLLLKVWNEILREHTDGLLVLVGAGGLDIHNCEHELQEYVQSSGIQRSVLFTGAVRNVAEYLQAADVFAFPTANDAFPSSVIEAMACALPVVATPVGAIKDIISNGKNGLLIEPGNAAQLFDALETVLTDANLAARLGQSARQTVEERYSAAQVTRRYYSLFDRLLLQLGNRHNFIKQKEDEI